MKRIAIAAFAAAVLTYAGLTYAASFCDPNLAPRYGKESGLPSNCRAYVQAAIDGYRAKFYTADDAMAGLERNCGVNGHLW